MKRIYNIILLFALFNGALFAHEGQQGPAEGLHEVQVTGTTTADGNYTFHFYSADGKLYRGYSEVFIALKDKAGNFTEDFTVSNFAPLMDMGMSKHSTPVGTVEKVEGRPLYRTWFSFLMYTGQMGGTWALDFDYRIGETNGKITGAVPQVVDYPANSKWIQSFNSDYYLSVVSPLSLREGSQALQAYVNKKTDVLQPYLIVEGGYKIVVTPWMVDMEHGSEDNTPLEWNGEKGVYEGTVNFGMEGNWRLYFKVLDAETDTLIAGDEGTESTLYWDVAVGKNESNGNSPIAAGAQAQVYPTLTDGHVTVEVPADATVSVFSFGGQRLQSRAAYAGTSLSLDLSRYGKGLYLVNIRTASGETITRKVIVK
jgi:hypothetical protein